MKFFSYKYCIYIYKYFCLFFFFVFPHICCYFQMRERPNAISQGHVWSYYVYMNDVFTALFLVYYYYYYFVQQIHACICIIFNLFILVRYWCVDYFVNFDFPHEKQILLLVDAYIPAQKKKRREWCFFINHHSK